MTVSRVPVLGVDIGGVIIDRINDKTDTSFFGPNYLSTTAVNGAFQSLNQLTQAGFRIYLVSKCGEAVEKKTRDWLLHYSFYSSTGVAEEDVRFCRTRQGKAAICSEIGATHFIDDRLEVLSYLLDVQNLYLFNANEREMQRFAHALHRVTRVTTWADILSILVKSLTNLRAAVVAPKI